MSVADPDLFLVTELKEIENLDRNHVRKDVSRGLEVLLEIGRNLRSLGQDQNHGKENDQNDLVPSLVREKGLKNQNLGPNPERKEGISGQDLGRLRKKRRVNPIHVQSPENVNVAIQNDHHHLSENRRKDPGPLPVHEKVVRNQDLNLVNDECPNVPGHTHVVEMYQVGFLSLDLFPVTGGSINVVGQRIVREIIRSPILDRSPMNGNLATVPNQGTVKRGKNPDLDPNPQIKHLSMIDK